MMRSAKLRFPFNISLLVKRATFRLLYFASGTSGRRTTLLRLGKVCLLVDRLIERSHDTSGYLPQAGCLQVCGHQKRRRMDCRGDLTRLVSYYGICNEGSTVQSSTDAYTRMPIHC